MVTSRYETEASLRTAIFGDILLCRDWVTKTRVVVKTVDLQLALKQTSRSQEPVQENVLHEVEVLTRVRSLGGHPNVINLLNYHVDKGSGILHMVLDYCEGGDLLDVCVQPPATKDNDGAMYNRNRDSRQENQEEDATTLKGGKRFLKQIPQPDQSGRNARLLNGTNGFKRLNENVVRAYLVDVLSGLRFLHDHGIAHRDISLENILLRKGRAIITDFGLCVQQLPVTSNPALGTSFYCVEAVGKNYYMAPEVLAHKPYDPRRADIWSTAISFFILLTLSPPFERADVSDSGFRYVKKHGIKAVLSAWGLQYKVSEAMQDLLSRMLRVDPMERISMEDIWQHPVLRGK